MIAIDILQWITFSTITVVDFQQQTNKMGASQSKSQKKEVICIDCDKSTQKDLPVSDGLSSEGMPCEEIYKKVEQCMDKHQGQGMISFYLMV